MCKTPLSFPLLQSWFLPWEAVLRELFQCEYFPGAAALHQLLGREGVLYSLPWGAVSGLPYPAGGFLLCHGAPLAKGRQQWIVFSVDGSGISALALVAHSPLLSSLTLVSAGLFVSHLLTPPSAG